jgi:hypothetical protein
LIDVRIRHGLLNRTPLFRVMHFGRLAGLKEQALILAN